ncbi:MAG TPA: hypothetical protein DCY13_17985 [Verrucomicrobiales bacterium]|nr:hypothetical protein [Verrucomicrobiales bacterium]
MPALAAEESPLAASQAAFDRWVQLQESIAGEKRDWALEKEYLDREIRLLREEIGLLQERETLLKEETATIDAELRRIEAETGGLKLAAARVEEKLPEFETAMRSLNRALPAALRSTIESLFQRLPREGATTPAGTAERLQVVVGILGQVDKFNGQLNVAPELRTNAAGEKISVSVLYLGLAQAWFVSQDGRFAGHGMPGPQGWMWTQDDSIAPLVSRAIAIQENTAVADYVDLPLSLE